MISASASGSGIGTGRKYSSQMTVMSEFGGGILWPQEWGGEQSSTHSGSARCADFASEHLPQDRQTISGLLSELNPIKTRYAPNGARPRAGARMRRLIVLCPRFRGFSGQRLARHRSTRRRECGRTPRKSKHQEGPPRGLTAASIAPAHILCCVELTQNFFAQLVGPGLTAATSFSADAGEFAGGAFDGRLDFSVTGDRGSLTISPVLTLRMI